MFGSVWGSVCGFRTTQNASSLEQISWPWWNAVCPVETVHHSRLLHFWNNNFMYYVDILYKVYSTSSLPRPIFWTETRQLWSQTVYFHWTERMIILYNISSHSFCAMKIKIYLSTNGIVAPWAQVTVFLSE